MFKTNNKNKQNHLSNQELTTESFGLPASSIQAIYSLSIWIIIGGNQHQLGGKIYINGVQELQKKKLAFYNPFWTGGKIYINDVQELQEKIAIIIATPFGHNRTGLANPGEPDRTENQKQDLGN